MNHYEYVSQIGWAKNRDRSGNMMVLGAIVSLLSFGAVLLGNNSSYISLIEEDWLRQAEAWIEPPKPAQA